MNSTLSSRIISLSVMRIGNGINADITSIGRKKTMALWREVEVCKKQLDEALSTVRENGIKWAEAERNYRLLKSQRILELNSKGYPKTLITDIVKGMEDVAELDFQRNVADVVYNANKEAINVKKLEKRTLESEMELEYGKGE